MRIAPVLTALVFLAAGLQPVRAAETYDLLFKTGTLSDVAQSEVLEYSRDVSVAQDTEFAERNTGIVKLSLEADDTARLKFSQGEKYKNLGAFPSTVGNPIIMYFVETVLRDVAHQAGGSPFYIRNRIKESLVQEVDIAEMKVALSGETYPAHQIVLRPFENDKNRARMKGFGDLTLTFTMSSDVPGWFQSLVANVPGGDGPIYDNRLVLQGSEVAQ